jgi:hypothetical protein
MLNMDRAEALRSIRYDLLEYIQRKVEVDFDNRRQAPASFVLNGKKHAVSEVLGRFKTGTTQQLNTYLVCSSSKDVFFLYFQLLESHASGLLERGCWILSFRILSDAELMAFYREDRRMPVDSSFDHV